MTCPDLDHLISHLTSEPGADPELEAHLQSCEGCQAELALIEQLVDSVRSPVMEVPEALNQRVLDRILKPQEASTSARPSMPQLIASGSLGFSTAFLAILASGSAGSSGPTVTLSLSLLMSSTAVMAQARFVRPSATYLGGEV